MSCNCKYKFCPTCDSESYKYEVSNETHRVNNSQNLEICISNDPELEKIRMKKEKIERELNDITETYHRILNDVTEKHKNRLYLYERQRELIRDRKHHIKKYGKDPLGQT